MVSQTFMKLLVTFHIPYKLLGYWVIVLLRYHWKANLEPFSSVCNLAEYDEDLFLYIAEAWSWTCHRTARSLKKSPGHSYRILMLLRWGTGRMTSHGNISSILSKDMSLESRSLRSWLINLCWTTSASSSPVCLERNSDCFLGFLL